MLGELETQRFRKLAGLGQQMDLWRCRNEKGGPVVMDRRGSVSAVKGPGQLAKEVLLGLFG